MARPRTSAKILKLRGAWSRNPQRERVDLEGAAPWDASVPEDLTGREKAAWREIVAALPQVALTSTERLGIEQMARIRAQLKDTHPATTLFKDLDAAFRQWAVQMGMTLAARAKLGTNVGSKKPKSGKYEGIKEPA